MVAYTPLSVNVLLSFTGLRLYAGWTAAHRVLPKNLPAISYPSTKLRGIYSALQKPSHEKMNYSALNYVSNKALLIRQ